LRLPSRAALALWSLAAINANAGGATLIPLERHADLGTFYVKVAVAELSLGAYLVDTGASYMTLTPENLSALQGAGNISYLRDLEGLTADGRSMRVPLYHLSEIVVNEGCVIRDVEAAVLPGSSRGLLGLSVLAKAAPFVFSTNPPTLSLSNCVESPPPVAPVGQDAHEGPRPY
jgi:predicted aspartyl protease